MRFHNKMCFYYWILLYTCQFKSSFKLIVCVTAMTLMHLYVFYRQVRDDGKDKNSVVSFTLTDEPLHIDLYSSNSKEEVRHVVLSHDRDERLLLLLSFMQIWIGYFP